jgi:hypothetical protein
LTPERFNEIAPAGNLRDYNPGIEIQSRHLIGPKQWTQFTSGRIFDFDWSVDRKQLLLAGGEINSDVVLLSNLAAR